MGVMHAGGAALYPWSTVHGGAAEFDGDTGVAERALGALASPVLVLDEVDAGTGARLGASVAQLLRRVATSSGQVLCVSHVPQVWPPPRRYSLFSLSELSACVQVACFIYTGVFVRGRCRGRCTCVQVAAHADRHVLVEKEMHGERPRTAFRVLEGRGERVAEVADMLGLDAAVAEDMLDTAQSMDGQSR